MPFLSSVESEVYQQPPGLVMIKKLDIPSVCVSCVPSRHITAAAAVWPPSAGMCLWTYVWSPTVIFPLCEAVPAFIFSHDIITRMFCSFLQNTVSSSHVTARVAQMAFLHTLVLAMNLQMLSVFILERQNFPFYDVLRATMRSCYVLISLLTSVIVPGIPFIIRSHSKLARNVNYVCFSFSFLIYHGGDVRSAPSRLSKQHLHTIFFLILFIYFFIICMQYIHR